MNDMHLARVDGCIDREFQFLQSPIQATDAMSILLNQSSCLGASGGGEGGYSKGSLLSHDWFDCQPYKAKTGA